MDIIQFLNSQKKDFSFKIDRNDCIDSLIKEAKKILSLRCNENCPQFKDLEHGPFCWPE